MADQQDVQTPSLEELPKVQSDLKSQLEQFDTQSLKNIEPQEKVVLPTAEGDYTHPFISLIMFSPTLSFGLYSSSCFSYSSSLKHL